MTTKEQNISANTLFAAAIGCFIQFIHGVLVIISPALFDNIIVPLIGQKESVSYFMSIMTPFSKSPFLFMFGLIFLLIVALLFLYASKNIRKNRRIKIWSMVSLIISFLLFRSSGNYLSIVEMLGFIGSITGLMHDSQAKK